MVVFNLLDCVIIFNIHVIIGCVSLLGIYLRMVLIESLFLLVGILLSTA